ncbi:MAG: DUF4301 family protein [Candidatus Izemoplasma sp.]|nr:DUF4301 family protein [Candidatus Izemoplasma sp.]
MDTVFNKFIQGTQYVTIESALKNELFHKVKYSEEINDNLMIKKFIPASGAATRMFQSLYTYLDDEIETDFIKTYSKNLDKFSFYNTLALEGLPIKDAIKKVLDTYCHTPKALIDIHKYNHLTVTPIEEHINETLELNLDNTPELHFTISKEHEKLFKQKLKEIDTKDMDITYSFQEPETDTLAVDMNNTPFLKDDGTPLYRPGGHGALIHNLNQLDADIIMIKNIDNVCHHTFLQDTIDAKKTLLNTGLYVQKKIHQYITDLLNGNYDLENINQFLQGTLNITYKKDLTKAQALKFLDRPLRVCGVVKNQGEPGGGPFIVDDGDYLSPQIVEMKEINLSNHQHIVAKAKYFNPVDLVCFVKDYQGNKYNLLDYLNDNRYFTSEKTYKGRPLKALEHPGLWNGAMHHWNTVFVEVPLTTFNPIKTVNDLLREGHLGYKLEEEQK